MSIVFRAPGGIVRDVNFVIHRSCVLVQRRQKDAAPAGHKCGSGCDGERCIEWRAFRYGQKNGELHPFRSWILARALLTCRTGNLHNSLNIRCTTHYIRRPATTAETACSQCKRRPMIVQQVIEQIGRHIGTQGAQNIRRPSTGCIGGVDICELPKVQPIQVERT
jgi:hypothetical protein